MNKSNNTKIKTRVCHWCGYTNHDGTDRPFTKIDGIDGHGECWNLVKTVLMHAGLATKETQMGELIKIMKQSSQRIEQKNKTENCPECKNNMTLINKEDNQVWLCHSCDVEYPITKSRSNLNDVL